MFSVILISSFYLLSEQLELSLLRKNNRDNIQYYEENLLWTDAGLLVTDDERKLQNGYISVFSLDRILNIEQTDEKYKIPDKGLHLDQF